MGVHGNYYVKWLEFSHEPGPVHSLVTFYSVPFYYPPGRLEKSQLMDASMRVRHHKLIMTPIKEKARTQHHRYQT